MKMQQTTISRITDPLEIVSAWRGDDLAPHVEAALNAFPYLRLRYGLSDILTALLTSKMALWLMKDGVRVKGFCLTEDPNYPRERVYTVLLAGGDGVSWTDFIADIERWAKSEGFQTIHVLSTEEMSDAASRLGYEAGSAICTLIFDEAGGAR